MSYYCYILESIPTGKYYIGSCADNQHRLDQHNKGYAKSTKNDRPWKQVHLEIFDSLKQARHRELQIKRWHSRKAIERLIKLGGKIEDPRPRP